MPPGIPYCAIKFMAIKFWKYARRWHLLASHTRVRALSAMLGRTRHLLPNPIATGTKNLSVAAQLSEAAMKSVKEGLSRFSGLVFDLIVNASTTLLMPRGRIEMT